ncbi:MAG TPA: class I SAM-dependent methyltransferase [Nitrospira sp.]|jgi:SAM-dependent methyltransferase|nr:class I SAM-dependent methyltransferase [Nitrospira sp.]
MGPAEHIERRGHVVGFREAITDAARQHDDAFFSWFDHAKDKEASFVRGSWDFLWHIAGPLTGYLTQPETKTALEIGHGGGRLLAAASRSFQFVIGVDIHDENDKVQAALRERGVSNARLFKTEGAQLPVGSAQVDCVYSFIVLQHVETYAVFRRYVEETFRVLKPGGLAVLYFARRYRWSFNRSSRVLYVLDRLLEPLLLRQGYEELPARVNHTNLRVSLRHGASLARALGFDVMRTLVSGRRVPDGAALYGGQHGLVLRKPD